MRSVWRSAIAYEGRQQRIAVVLTSASCVCKSVGKLHTLCVRSNRTAIRYSSIQVVYILHVCDFRLHPVLRAAWSQRQAGVLAHFTVFFTYFVLFSYESISWDVQDIDNRQGFLADSLIRVVSMTALPIIDILDIPRYIELVVTLY